MEITIKNFKSIKEIVITPKKINIFYGLNESGKTSILEALALVRGQV